MAGQLWELTLAVYHKLYTLCALAVTCAHRGSHKGARWWGLYTLSILYDHERKMVRQGIEV